jgi:hypothetical protein
MSRHYQSFKLDSGTARSPGGSPDSFSSDSAGAGRGIPADGSRAPAGQKEQGPFDPPRYWEFFPGTD